MRLPTQLLRLKTKRSYKRQGHATFEALCWLFCVVRVETELTVGKHRSREEIAFFSVKTAESFS